MYGLSVVGNRRCDERPNVCLMSEDVKINRHKPLNGRALKYSLSCVTLLCGLQFSLLLVSSAFAGTGIDPTNSYAWAENVGWLNAAPTNSGVMVYFDGTSGYLTGYVWGENIGWIKMGDQTGGPYANNSATNWGVNLDATGTLSGYAWGENVGWITFSPSNSVTTVDKTTGRFTGKAWGENIGWISFEGVAPAYNVRTMAFDTQPLGTPNWWLTQHAVVETYDAGDGIPAWKKYVMDTDPNVLGDVLRIESLSNLPPATVTFRSSSRRYYTLQRCDDLTTGIWTNVASQTAIPGVDGLISLFDTTGATQQFYRVEVKVAP